MYQTPKETLFIGLIALALTLGSIYAIWGLQTTLHVFIGVSMGWFVKDFTDY